MSHRHLQGDGGRVLEDKRTFASFLAGTVARHMVGRMRLGVGAGGHVGKAPTSVEPGIAVATVGSARATFAVLVLLAGTSASCA
jgi:hypothetical protein